MADQARKREGQQLLLRFPEGSDLRDRLDEVARVNMRSLSAEILHRLDRSLIENDEAEAPTRLENRVTALEVAVSELRSAFGTDDATEDDDDQSPSGALLKHAKTLARK